MMFLRKFGAVFSVPKFQKIKKIDIFCGGSTALWAWGEGISALFRAGGGGEYMYPSFKNKKKSLTPFPLFTHTITHSHIHQSWEITSVPK